MWDYQMSATDYIKTIDQVNKVRQSKFYKVHDVPQPLTTSIELKVTLNAIKFGIAKIGDIYNKPKPLAPIDSQLTKSAKAVRPVKMWEVYEKPKQTKLINVYTVENYKSVFSFKTNQAIENNFDYPHVKPNYPQLGSPWGDPSQAVYYGDFGTWVWHYFQPDEHYLVNECLGFSPLYEEEVYIRFLFNDMKSGGSESRGDIILSNGRTDSYQCRITMPINFGVYNFNPVMFDGQLCWELISHLSKTSLEIS